MSTKIGIGFSQEVDLLQAAEAAATQAKDNLQIKQIDLAIVLHTSHYDPKKIVPVIQKVLGKTKLVGSSAAGIILSDYIKTRGIAILTISSEDMKFGIGSVSNIHTQDNRQAGNILAKNSLADFGPLGRHVFMFFVDSRLKRNSQFLKGLQEVFGSVFPIVGAGSCDDFRFIGSHQIFQNRILEHSATGLIMGGNMTVGIGGGHGWSPLGKPRIADSVNGNIIKTIDGKEASHIYEEYFGSEAENIKRTKLGQLALFYPLGIYVEENNEYLLRNAVDILENGSIVCQGEVPQGSRIHIMIGNKESCKQAAVEAAQEASKNLFRKNAKLVIVLESMARLKLLGRMAFQEIEAIRQVFGYQTPVFGMYANGEISPFLSDEEIRKPHFQNESIVVLAIS